MKIIIIIIINKINKNIIVVINCNNTIITTTTTATITTKTSTTTETWPYNNFAPTVINNESLVLFGIVRSFVLLLEMDSTGGRNEDSWQNNPDRQFLEHHSFRWKSLGKVLSRSWDVSWKDVLKMDLDLRDLIRMLNRADIKSKEYLKKPTTKTWYYKILLIINNNNYYYFNNYYQNLSENYNEIISNEQNQFLTLLLRLKQSEALIILVL